MSAMQSLDMHTMNAVSKGARPLAPSQPCTNIRSLQHSSNRERCAAPQAAVLRGKDAPLQPSSRRAASFVARAAPAEAAVEDVSADGAAPPIPTSAETARTVLDIVAHGTLATIDEDGKPLGTYASYVLDGKGQPVLRLRADAVHTRNLLCEAACSLFVQPNELPARLLARVTLKGQVEEVVGPERQTVALLHRHLHGEGVGVDAPQDSDLYYRLRISHCFYVGGLGGGAAAEVISAAELADAAPDKLRNDAAALAEQWNVERAEDVLRIAAEATQVKFEELVAAQLLWVDRLGMYLYIQKLGEAEGQVHRAPFTREVLDERDARSVLTMLAQVSWERERNYTPVMPVLVPETINN